jgi:hypothetical protein
LTLKIRYHLSSDLPKLAWLAAFDQKKFDELSVFHGSSVECRPEWMIEGVWDGDFQSGNFHQAENVFGSGIRIEGDCVYFVSSSAMNDHLMYCFDGVRLLVSNSLTVLLGYTGAALDDKHDYYRESVSISKGIREYEKEFRVIHPQIDTFFQVFYENMVVKKSGISFALKNGLYAIKAFEQYYDLLWSVLCRIRDNYEDPARSIAISAYTTISSGYDSTAVTCLAKQLGVDTCFTVTKTPSLRRWSSKHTIDDGVMAAQALNLKIIYADALPHSITENELFFLSTNYGTPDKSPVLNEIAFSSVAAYIEKHSSAAVLFTGYHGDKVWNTDTPENFLGEDLTQSNGANFGFSEIRLKSGFINVAVPFILARNIRSIVTISRSEEMEPWSLHNNYDRPIARRIAESCGVKRQAFGMHKKGVACIYYRLPKSCVLRKHFFKFLKKRYDLSLWFIFTNHALNQAAFVFQVALRASKLKLKNLRTTIFWPNMDIGFLMWIWASQLLSDRVYRALNGRIEFPDEG